MRLPGPLRVALLERDFRKFRRPDNRLLRSTAAAEGAKWGNEETEETEETVPSVNGVLCGVRCAVCCVLFTIANTRVSFFLSFLSFKGVCGILLQLYVLFDSAPSQAPNVVVALGVLVGLGMILLPIVGICSLSTRRTRRVTDAILWSVLIEVR